MDDPRRVPEACAIVAAIDRRPVKVICYSKEACDSAGGLGILSLPEAEPARPWVYCADAEPAEAGRYEAAICGAAPCRLNFSPLHGWEWSGVFPPAVYAWRASDGAVPSIRPADRSYLLTQGVPAEWLGAPEED